MRFFSRFFSFPPQVQFSVVWIRFFSGFKCLVLTLFLITFLFFLYIYIYILVYKSMYFPFFYSSMSSNMWPHLEFVTKQSVTWLESLPFLTTSFPILFNWFPFSKWSLTHGSQILHYPAPGQTSQLWSELI